MSEGEIVAFPVENKATKAKGYYNVETGDVVLFDGSEGWK